ncbi:hypothetical protein AADZ86_07725 [Colwelliaceae bacterium BS250]
MPIIVNLFLAAIQPKTFFLPCAAIILGSGLAALNGVVDGVLFSSLLIITILTQITFNLANDYQRAFLTNSSVVNSKNPKIFTARGQMLKLILGCYITTMLALMGLTYTSTTSANTGYVLLATIVISLLIILRVKTSAQQPKQTLELTLKPVTIFAQLSLVGALPTVVSYYLHTAQLPFDIMMVAFICGLLSLLVLLATQIKEFIKASPAIDSAAIPKPLKHLINAQKIVLISTVIATALFIYFAYIPQLSGFFALSLPSIYAAIVTIEHYPETDVATSQVTKISISCFAYWVLFVIGMML